MRVKEGSIFPADMVFLRSTDSKAPKSCWVNTKSLDGETDNKFRKALKVVLLLLMFISIGYIGTKWCGS